MNHGMGFLTTLNRPVYVCRRFQINKMNIRIRNGDNYLLFHKILLINQSL